MVNIARLCSVAEFGLSQEKPSTSYLSLFGEREILDPDTHTNSAIPSTHVRYPSHKMVSHHFPVTSSPSPTQAPASTAQAHPAPSSPTGSVLAFHLTEFGIMFSMVQAAGERRIRFQHSMNELARKLSISFGRRYTLVTPKGEN